MSAATQLVPIQYEPVLRAALLEDLGTAGDLTTDAVVGSDAMAEGALVARTAGRAAGIDIATATFALLDPDVTVDVEVADGDDVDPGEVLATVRGRARSILTGERVALNVLGHLSGVATTTAQLVAAASGHRARIVPTRKTLPGLRALQRYAVRVGGGVDHRFGLDDGVLIKDNHIAVAGGVTAAVERARARIGHMVKVEVEVDTLAQLDEAVGQPIDAVLLDNMPTATLAEAVQRTPGHIVTEASGGITPETAPAVAATGVDLISVGWLTHSARALDVGLDFATTGG
ncbi:MAG: carboxylating nicotinate-nucleotide diphosphorylase [Actinobacteria bacterium]|nr:carboxylating nicotinate-nucleotide diphosphorylase [Actinomycetota bacterium]